MFDMEFYREPAKDEKCLVVVDSGTQHSEFFVLGKDVQKLVDDSLKKPDVDVMVFSYCKGYTNFEEE